MTDWSLAFCGDWAPTRELGTALGSDPISFYGDLLPILRRADLAIVNLEGVLADGELTPIVKDGISLRFPARLVSGLTVVPFRLACLANNHSMDFGVEGLARTQSLLREHGIGHTGAGATVAAVETPAVFSFGQTQLAVLNVAEGEEGRALRGKPGVAPMDVARVSQRIESLRAQVDVIAVVTHAGREGLPIPAPYVREAYRAFADCGADLVVGSHPHVPQGVESHGRATIAYSLGNFALWMGTAAPYQYIGYIGIARFRDAELVAFETVPYRIQPDGLTLLAGGEQQDFVEHLNLISSLLEDDARLHDLWCAYADHWLLSDGLEELADSVSALAGNARLIRSWLRSVVKRHQGDRLGDRMARRWMWGIHSRLEGRTRDPLSSATPEVTAAAAVLRNRLDTPAHRELLLTALRRVMDGTHGMSPTWALEMLRNWQVL